MESNRSVSRRRTFKGVALKKLVLGAVIGFLLGVMGTSWWYLHRLHTRSSDMSSLLHQMGWFYTTRHLVASGHDAVTSFLESHKDPDGNSLANTLKVRYAACVRVENRYGFSKEGGFSSNSGSGVIVGGGRFVLTAGHLFRDRPGVGDSQGRIVLTTGQLIDFDLHHLEYDSSKGLDLAILRINAAPVPVLPIEMVEARVGQTVFTLGYLESLGLGRDSALQENMPISDKANNYLEPLVQVGRIQSVSERIVIRPIVGCTAWVGLSGSPVLDEGGRLVGIFVDLHRRRDRQREEYTMHAVPVITGRQEPVPLLIGQRHQAPTANKADAGSGK